MLNKINNATTKEDLMSIWNHLSLERQKEMMTKEILSISGNMMETRGIYFKSSSLTDIFPNELVTKILSFDCHNREHPLIDKTMKKSFEINERETAKQHENEKQAQKHRLQLIQNEKDKYFDNFIDENTQYWIVDRDRDTLTAEEIAKGYNGPLISLMHAVDLCRDNSVIFIASCDVEYFLEPRIPKKIAFVGTGKRDNVRIQFFRDDDDNNNNDWDYDIHLEKDVYFANLCLSTNFEAEYVWIRKSAYFKNTRLNLQPEPVASERNSEMRITLSGNLHCLLSEFKNHLELEIAEPSSNIEFKGCDLNMLSLHMMINGPMDSFIFVGNKFGLSSAYMHPIRLRGKCLKGAGTCAKNIVLKDNYVDTLDYLLGKNGWSKLDANTIWDSIHEAKKKYTERRMPLLF